jgi:hypothetical protein
LSDDGFASLVGHWCIIVVGAGQAVFAPQTMAWRCHAIVATVEAPVHFPTLQHSKNAACACTKCVGPNMRDGVNGIQSLHLGMNRSQPLMRLSLDEEALVSKTYKYTDSYMRNCKKDGQLKYRIGWGLRNT